MLLKVILILIFKHIKRGLYKMAKRERDSVAAEVIVDTENKSDEPDSGLEFVPIVSQHDIDNKPCNLFEKSIGRAVVLMAEVKDSTKLRKVQTERDDLVQLVKRLIDAPNDEVVQKILEFSVCKLCCHYLSEPEQHFFHNMCTSCDTNVYCNEWCIGHYKKKPLACDTCGEKVCDQHLYKRQCDPSFHECDYCRKNDHIFGCALCRAKKGENFVM